MFSIEIFNQNQNIVSSSVLISLQKSRKLRAGFNWQTYRSFIPEILFNFYVVPCMNSSISHLAAKESLVDTAPTSLHIDAR